MTARKHGVSVDGTALVCSSGNEERDGHGSTTGRAGGRTTARAVTVGGVATVVGVDAIDVTERAAVEDDDDRAEPPQPARLTHPITAMTAGRSIG